MTREEVIVELQMMLLRHVNDDGSSIFDNAEIEAIHRAIDALRKGAVYFDEWCNDCKEYDKEKHSCPRWNRVIRKTVEELRKEND